MENGTITDDYLQIDKFLFTEQLSKPFPKEEK